MSFSSQTFRGRAALEPASTPKIYNIVSPITPGTEFSVVLSALVKKLTIRTRGNGNLNVCFEVGMSGVEYITIPGSATKDFGDIGLENATLYLQTNKPSEVVEILEWT